MKIYTRSRRAVDAQHGVMEFLLINHPLDCPICDQGGECELQDLAMGYGRSVSRFTERKRVVKDKNVGPLIQTDMTRCIHCTRCVRFLEEIAGTSEMGGSGRGDRLEIGTCIETSIDSELSGNIIDVCPVGALTNKPFLFSARAWELEARSSVAAHDGVGSKLYYHRRRGKILRAVPAESEAANETWLSDRDRYSHFGLYSEDRVLEPRVRENGEWRTVSWEEGLSAAADAIRNVTGDHGAEQLGVLMSPGAFTEEYFLAQKLARGQGCNNIDHRLREQDFADDGALPLSPAFESKIAGLENAPAILLVGSNIRHEAPILGHRVRKAWRAGASVMAVNPLDWAFHFDLTHKVVSAPQHLCKSFAAVALAVAELKDTELPARIASLTAGHSADETHRQIASTLADSDSAILVVGQAAMSHPEAAGLRQLASWIASATGSLLNVLPHGGNSTGAWLAGAVPHRGPGGQSSEAGMNAREMIENPRKAYLLWDFEPDFDMANPTAVESALSGADKVVAISSFATGHLESLADVILPLAPSAESEGSLFNLDSVESQLSPAGRVSGQCKPGWKILRRLGAELGLDGFGQVSLDDVRDEISATLDGQAAMTDIADLKPEKPGKALHRVGEVAMYGLDPLCRRSDALQQTVHAECDFVGLNAGDAASLGIGNGDTVTVDQGGETIELEARIDEAVPEGAAWLRSASCSARVLGDSYGPVNVHASGGSA